MLHWEPIKHLLHYLRGTCQYKLTIYHPRLQHDSNFIVYYADADLKGEADYSKSTSGIIIFALRILGLGRSKTPTLVAQSTMQAEMFATAYVKVQLDSLRDVICEIELGADMTRCIFNDGLNSVTTLNSGNFQSGSRHLRLKYHTIQQDFAKEDIEIKHLAGTEMLADALNKALGGVKLGEFAIELV